VTRSDRIKKKKKKRFNILDVILNDNRIMGRGRISSNWRNGRVARREGSMREGGRFVERRKNFLLFKFF